MLGLLAVSGAAQIRDRTQHQAAPTDDNQAQITAKPKKRGPRAIAVVELLPGGGTRLVPIALWIDDRFYDASLYGANPEPMALEPETVYEATNYGEPAGFFTVTTPEQLKGSWIATGQWKPHLAMDEKVAQQKAKQPKPPPANPLDDRPVLRRAGSDASSSGTSNSGAGNSGTSSSPSSGSDNSSAGNASPSGPPDRPTLKKPASDTSTSSSAPSSSTPAPAAPASNPSSSSASSASPDESDPNRPTLRRGKPTAQSAAAQPTNPVVAQSAATTAAVQAAQVKLATTMASTGRRSYPAISDATPREGRSLLYVMNSSERAERSEQMRALALDAIRKFIAKRNTPAVPKTAAITDYDLRAFDLEYSNSPTLVLTATLPVPSARALRGGDFDYFVTVVAREDINGTPIQIFTSVSDSNHLDAFPRMEIIDAVDADANGRGDLLFRQYSDVGVSYSLFRVHPYDMEKIFEGGAGV
jgi:hypothetical protein